MLSEINSTLVSSELCEMAKSHGTDKWEHGYTKIYHEIMKSFKDQEINIFEIGIYNGCSLTLWYDFFKKGKVFGIDNGRIINYSPYSAGSSNENPSDDDEKLLSGSDGPENFNFDWIENDRIKCFIADQRSKLQLKSAFEYFKCSDFDFIIDDGHHYQEHQQKSLGILYQHIKSGGYYIIEDICSFDSMLLGKYWGQNEDATNSTDYVIGEYLKTGTLKSEFISKKNSKYIEDNIDDIFLFDCNGKNNSPVNGDSKLLVIKKK